MSIVFVLERTNQLSLLPDKDLVDLCHPIKPYQATKNQRFFIFYYPTLKGNNNCKIFLISVGLHLTKSGGGV
ncbi:hypothetical protein [Microcystis aeruginosa]|uniref:hypothetical protein n=1 Tax=Microcystis aeruginosa TaxID=1126 RepID=UPI0013053B62|nr:hypothetical protein [Microcystis aeruginosa]